MINTATWERSVYPGMRVLIKDAEEAFAPEHPRLFNVLSSSQAYEEEFSWAGLGSFQTKPEGRPVANDEPVPGVYKRYNQATWGLSFRVTLEMRMFEKYGQIRQISEDLGDSCRESIEVLLSGILNTSLTTNGPDGVPLFSTAHPLLRGGTFSNRLSTLADLHYVSYSQMLTLFETTVSHEGRKRRMTPSLLWYGPHLDMKGQELLQSPDRPDTINRAKNVLRKVQPFMYHYLSSATMWGMKAARDFTRVFFALRPTVSKSFDWATEDFMVKELFMLSYGYTDPRGWFLGNQ